MAPGKSLLMMVLMGLTAAVEINPALIRGSPSRYVRATYRVGLDEAVAITCSFRNTEASLGYFALGSEADFTGRMIIWQKVDSTGGEELIAIGSRVDPKLGAFHDYRALFADATTSVLFIPRTTHYHAGYYKCSLSDGGFLHQMVHLNVTDPLVVVRHPMENTHYIDVGAPVRLACDVRASYPPPLIYWTFGRPRMQKSIRPVAWGRVLSFNAMNPNLAGTYTCHADNFLRPPISTSYRLLILKKKPGSKPSFLKAQYNHSPARFATKKPRYGHLYALTCRSNGSPPIFFNWLRNAINVTQTKDPNLSIHMTKASNGDVISELQIRQFKLKDRGNYTCKAYNSYGSRSHTFYLFSITDLPSKLRGKVDDSSKRWLSYPKRIRPPVDDDDFGDRGSGFGDRGSGSGPKMPTTTSPPQPQEMTSTMPSRDSRLTDEEGGSGAWDRRFQTRFDVSKVSRIRTGG